MGVVNSFEPDQLAEFYAGKSKSMAKRIEVMDAGEKLLEAWG